MAKALKGIQPYIGPALQTHSVTLQRPCVDENNSYHAERCDRAACKSPWCGKGKNRRTQQYQDTMRQIHLKGGADTIVLVCDGCGATVKAPAYWRVVEYARASGWRVDGRRRLCGKCAEEEGNDDLQEAS